MDENPVAVLTQSLTSIPSRRDVLRGLAGGAFGSGLAWLSGMAEAKNKGTNPPKKSKAAKPNPSGCLGVGATCKNAGQCCSGSCEGKKCRAHDAGICKVDYDLCTTGAAHVCSLVYEIGTTCACVLTTGKAPFCGHFDGELACQECAKDEDCKDLGKGAACVVVGAGICEGQCAETGGRACVAPCPKPAK